MKLKTAIAMAAVSTLTISSVVQADGLRGRIADVPAVAGQPVAERESSDRREYYADLDLNRAVFLYAGSDANIASRNVIRIRVERDGSRNLDDIFRATYYNDAGSAENLGSFRRRALSCDDVRRCGSLPGLRNAQATVIVAVQAVSILSGVGLIEQAGYAGAMGAPAAVTAPAYAQGLWNIFGGPATGLIMGAIAEAAPQLQENIASFGNNTGAGHQTGRATLERALKEALLEGNRNNVSNAGDEMVLVGSRGLNLGGWQVTSDADGASDLAVKMRDIIRDLNRTDSQR